MSQENVLVAHELTKSFKTPSPFTLLKGVSIEILRGNSYAITGKSGEGKSTLLHILGTLEKATSGSLEICGENTRDCSLSKLRNEKLGFVFQGFHLLDDESVLDNVLMPARIGRSSTSKHSDMAKRAHMLLEMVGLTHRSQHFAKLLSGGEKQRVAIARALINDPDLIFADEPSGNLDSMHSGAIHDLLLSCVKNDGKALIVVTHDEELAKLCDHKLLLKEGLLQ